MPLGIAIKFDTIEVDVEDIYNAIKKNGYEHVRGSWFGADGGACVMGQGAKNLGVAASTDVFIDTLDKMSEKEEFISDEYADEFGEVWEKYNLNTQLNTLTVPEESKWWLTGTGTEAGAVIAYWNDKVDFTRKNPGYWYFLQTYEEVVAMVYDILSPYFGTKVKLLKHDYS